MDSVYYQCILVDSIMFHQISHSAGHITNVILVGALPEPLISRRLQDDAIELNTSTVSSQTAYFPLAQMRSFPRGTANSSRKAHNDIIISNCAQKQQVAPATFLHAKDKV